MTTRMRISTPGSRLTALHSPQRFTTVFEILTAPQHSMLLCLCIVSTALMMIDAQAGQGMPGPGPGPGQVPVRRPHDPRMRGADPRQQAHPRPVQPIQQPQPKPQPQQAPAANLPAEQQKGTSLLGSSSYCLLVSHWLCLQLTPLVVSHEVSGSLSM